MPDRTLRVVVWSTGGIGSLAIGAIHDRPDCVVYAASGPERDAASVPDYLRLLEAGINVVTTSSTNLVNPSAYDPSRREQLEDATRKGSASLYNAGIHPGFALDQLTLTLATQSKSIRSIHAFELGLYDDYAIRGEYDRRATEEPLGVAFGKVPAGSCGAIRMRASGIVDGREAIVIEHVTRAREIAPEWPIAEGAVTYRVVIDGDPDVECTMSPSLKDPAAAGIGWMSSGAGAMMSTAMRAMNAVPYFVAAPPGLLHSLSMPLTLPKHAFAVARGR